jgi:hypothetical protein
MIGCNGNTDSEGRADATGSILHDDKWYISPWGLSRESIPGSRLGQNSRTCDDIALLNQVECPIWKNALGVGNRQESFNSVLRTAGSPAEIKKASSADRSGTHRLLVPGN